jgi:hypothetical protein
MNDKGRTVQFVFKTIGQKKEWENYAESKGLSLPALAKFSLFQYRSHYKKIGGKIRVSTLESVMGEELNDGAVPAKAQPENSISET